MTAEEREKLYDEEIAPELLKLAQKCLDNGLSMVVGVEWDPTNPDEGGCGSTLALQPGEILGLPIAIQAMAVRAGRNVDALVIGISRHCHRYGIDTSQSVYLNVFKDPPKDVHSVVLG